MSFTPIYTKIGDTDAFLVGSGQPMVVIHGGPGLDHCYLVNFLTPLGLLREMVFYNQIGCGKDSELPKDFTVSSLFEQFINIVQNVGKGKTVDVLAHSWGAYIFYEALRLRSDINIRRAILVSPVGLNRKRFDASGERLMSRIPDDVLRSVEDMEANGRGADVMNIVAPYYFADPQNNIDIVFNHYNPATYYKVVEFLGEFDCSDVSNYLPEKTSLIYGEKDIERPVDTREIHDIASVTIIPGAGHFSFAEKPEEFLRTARHLLSE